MFLFLLFFSSFSPSPPSSNRKTWVNKIIDVGGDVGGNQMQVPEQGTLQGFSDGAAFEIQPTLGGHFDIYLL